MICYSNAYDTKLNQIMTVEWDYDHDPRNHMHITLGGRSDDSCNQLIFFEVFLGKM